MANIRSILKFRRRQEGRTNYRKRLTLLKSGNIRFIVRPSNRHVQVQLVDYEPKGDKIILSCKSDKLKAYGWKAPTGNLPSAYLTGLLCGRLSKGKIKVAILDSGRSSLSKGNIAYAALRGIMDAGVAVKHSPDKFPGNERVSGRHIKNYAEQLKKINPEKYKNTFSSYLKSGIAPEEFESHFESVKKKIMEL